MTTERYKRALLGVSLAGLAFSGYLSAVKLFTATCALSEPCPYVLGYPACWYGFAFFLILFISAITGLLGAAAFRNSIRIQVIASGFGILFSGYVTFPEIVRMFSGLTTYILGLPTCAYGFIFYIIIFIFSVRQLNTNPKT